jgi:hypothetical protein
MTELALGANDSYDVQWNGQAYRLDLDIAPERQSAATAQRRSLHAPSPFAVTAHACGDRRLVATAAACVDSSSMIVTGKLGLVRASSGEVVASDVPFTGTLKVYSLVIGRGQLDVQFDGGRVGFEGEYRGAYEVGAYDLSGLLGPGNSGR